jgi:hypothetical protein
MRLPIIRLFVAGLLVVGVAFTSARSASPLPNLAAMAMAVGGDDGEATNWREILVVNKDSLKYHIARSACGNRIGENNAIYINGTSMKKARRYVELLGCTPCENCFRK